MSTDTHHAENKNWLNVTVSFLLSLVFGGLGLLALVEWREAMLVVLAKARVYSLTIPVIDKVFLIFSCLSLLLTILFLHDWFSDGLSQRLLRQRLTRALSVALFSLFGAHLTFTLAVDKALWAKGWTLLVAAELVTAIILLSASLIRPSQRANHKLPASR